MPKVFLAAEWRNLIMANYIIDPAVLQKHLPCRTELDTFNGHHYVSLVGFLFKNVKVLGLSFPFHTSFEEVNLRFYVRYRENNSWKRGVVFMKEIVPRRMINFVANTLYGENYATHRMKHRWQQTAGNLEVEYHWKVGKEWNYIKSVAEGAPKSITEGSAEEFITEHYWGYTFMDESCTGVYEVAHPKWKVHPIKSYDINCSTGLLYGAEFSEALSAAPASVFLAEGSAIQVMKGGTIKL